MRGPVRIGDSPLRKMRRPVPGRSGMPRRPTSQAAERHPSAGRDPAGHSIAQWSMVDRGPRPAWLARRRVLSNHHPFRRQLACFNSLTSRLVAVRTGDRPVGGGRPARRAGGWWTTPPGVRTNASCPTTAASCPASSRPRSGSATATGSATSGELPGIEPPEEWKRYCDWQRHFRLSEFGCGEWVELAQKMFDFTGDNVFVIGTVGEAPNILLTNNDLRNVPTDVLGRPTPVRPLPSRLTLSTGARSHRTSRSSRSLLSCPVRAR